VKKIKTSLAKADEENSDMLKDGKFAPVLL
jgi:hypothetical protein